MSDASALAGGRAAALLSDAADAGREVVLVSGEMARSTSWDELVDHGRAAGARLRELGCGPDSPVALLEPTSFGAVAAILGALLAEVPLTVLATSHRPSDRGRERLERSIAVARPAVVVSGTEYAVPTGATIISSSDLTASGPAFDGPIDGGPDRLAILQFTSGSTARPRAVMVTETSLTTNVAGLAEALALDPATDTVVSWLPLFHDMGLVGQLLLSAFSGTRLVLAGPTDFALAPQRWLRWISTYGGTVSLAPNAAYGALVSRRPDPALDLGSWRVVATGAERVDMRLMTAFCERYRDVGLDPKRLVAGYGLAEATLVVTVSGRARGLGSIVVDAGRLTADGVAVLADEGVELAVVGAPVRGVDVRIKGERDVLGEDEIGEVQVRGPNVTQGYLGEPEATEALFDEGWLRTGDLGFLHEGELVIVGRLKDLIIVGGRNYAPEEVERAATVPGLRPGCVVAFGVVSAGTERVVVVAEPAAELDEERIVSLQQAARSCVLAALGVRLDELVLVPPGSVPKTTSGKLQRGQCRERYLSGIYSADGA